MSAAAVPRPGADGRYLGLIPARGGSKGVPGKNLRVLAGHPLIAHTIRVAQECPSLTHVVVSTDDPKIAEVARRYGAEVPFMRPAALAGGDVAMEPVVQHAIGEMEQLWGHRIDYVVLLLPTNPVRTARRVEQAIQLQRQTGADTVVSLVENDYPVHWLKKIVDGRVVPFSLDLPTLRRRQDAPVTYRKNNAVFVVQRDIVMLDHSLFGTNTRALIMGPEESLDLNTEWDFTLAELILERRDVILTDR